MIDYNDIASLTTIAEQWQRYCVMLPEGAGPTQIDETEQAFYAGAQAVLTLITNAVPQDETADVTAKMLTLLGEIADYAHKRFGP